MPTLLIGFDQILPQQDALRVLEALLPRSKPCSYTIWPTSTRCASGRINRKIISRSDSGWDAVWHQFISDWKTRASGESSTANISSFLNDIPKLLNSSCYSDVAVFGPAPRTALSSACARALRVALLSLKKARLIWIDLSPNPPKSATLSFSRILLNSNNALVNPVLVQAHLKFFRPDTLGLAPPNTLDIFKSTIVLPDGSQIPVRAYNIKSKIEVHFAVNARACRRTLITADAELSSSACWFSLRKKHSVMSNLEINDVALVVKVGTLWGVLFPFSDLIFLVFNINTSVYDRIISKLDRLDPQSKAPIQEKPQDDQEFYFRGEMISDLASNRSDALIETDFIAVEHNRDDVFERLEALRHARLQEPEKPVVSFKNVHSPTASLVSFLHQIVLGQANIDELPKKIREILMLQSPSEVSQQVHGDAAESLGKAIASLSQEGLADSIASVQLQMVTTFEVALLSNSFDPVNQETLSDLQRYAASLSVMFAGNGSKGLEDFLETTLVKFYGARFPLTLLELYDNLDLHPPCMLSKTEDDEESTQTLVLPESETFTDAATAGLPESPVSFSKNPILNKQGSNLLELIAQESSKRRRTVSCFSSRLENTVKWNRSFCDRDPKRRRSDSSFVITTDTKSSAASGLHILVEASPIRDPGTPLKDRKSEFQVVVSESPLSVSYSDTVKLNLQEHVVMESPNVKRTLTFENC